MQKDKSLFQISEDVTALEEFLIALDGDVSDDAIEAKIDAWFAGIAADRNAKLNSYCALLSKLEYQQNARRAEIARLQLLNQTDERTAERLKKRLKWFVEKHSPGKAIDTVLHRISVQNNGGVCPVNLSPEAENNPAELPEQFRRVKFSANIDTIRRALEAGEELDFAQLGERGRSLRIK